MSELIRTHESKGNFKWVWTRLRFYQRKLNIYSSTLSTFPGLSQKHRLCSWQLVVCVKLTACFSTDLQLYDFCFILTVSRQQSCSYLAPSPPSGSQRSGLLRSSTLVCVSVTHLLCIAGGSRHWLKPGGWRITVEVVEERGERVEVAQSERRNK